jgi:hypothetical protein
MMIPGGAYLRPVNFIITSLVVRPLSPLSPSALIHLLQFVFVSNQTAQATGLLTEWICLKPASLPKPNTSRPTATASGGPEYVPLASVPTEGMVEDDKVEEQTVEEEEVQKPTVWDRIKEATGKDLRVRFLFIIAGLWVVNHVCTSYPLLSLLDDELTGLGKQIR